MTDVYPLAPGFKARNTSREAAQAIAPKAKTLRERVLEAVKAAPGTPETIAARLGLPLLSIRPRFSELSALGKIRDTGKRGTSDGGKRAIVWEAVS